MFHVSFLKKQVGFNVVPHVDLPIVTEDGLIHDVQQAILSRIMYKKMNVGSVQHLVQWHAKEANDATWEDYDDFKVRFPYFAV